MPDPDDIHGAPSIAPAFATCLKVYRHLYLSLTRPDCRVVDQVDVSKVCDNYGRLNVWGSDWGALRTGRGSLDDLLRTNESLRSIVLDTISDLTKSIERATVLADVGPATEEENLLTDDSDGDSLSSASATSESFLDGGNRSRSKKGEIHYTISGIFIHVQSLYKISVSLRRPAVHDNYIRSVSKIANASYFIPWYHSYVESMFPDASEVLVHRLALANTWRRQQLEYWVQHPQDAAEGILSEAAVPPKESKQTQSLGIPSRTTKKTFSTVASSAANNNDTFSGRPKTIYQPSLLVASGHLRIPDMPKVDSIFGQTSFECPYCRAQLDVQTMQKQELWKEHVFRDLRPYVCTYEDCPNAEKLYVTRHDWTYHGRQLHQRSWICGNKCNCKFSSPHLFKEHMLECHLGTFAEPQLPILIDMCERPADPDERASCPLCGEQATLRTIQAHVASHLEDIALFVLPVETDDHDTDANSHQAKLPREKDNRLDEDKISTLGSFDKDEDVLAPVQDSKVSETALKNKEEYLQPEVGDRLNKNDRDYSLPEARSWLHTAKSRDSQKSADLYRVNDEVHIQTARGVDPTPYRIWKVLGHGQYKLSGNGKSNGKVYLEQDLQGVA